MEQRSKHIDNLFREGLNDYKESPSAGVWDALEQRLPVATPATKPSYKWVWLLLLLSFMAIVSYFVAKNWTSLSSNINKPQTEQNTNDLLTTNTTNILPPSTEEGAHPSKTSVSKDSLSHIDAVKKPTHKPINITHKPNTNKGLSDGQKTIGSVENAEKKLKTFADETTPFQNKATKEGLKNEKNVVAETPNVKDVSLSQTNDKSGVVTNDDNAKAKNSLSPNVDSNSLTLSKNNKTKPNTTSNSNNKPPTVNKIENKKTKNTLAKNTNSNSSNINKNTTTNSTTTATQNENILVKNKIANGKTSPKKNNTTVKNIQTNNKPQTATVNQEENNIDRIEPDAKEKPQPKSQTLIKNKTQNKTKTAVTKTKDNINQTQPKPNSKLLTTKAEDKPVVKTTNAPLKEKKLIVVEDSKVNTEPATKDIPKAASQTQPQLEGEPDQHTTTSTIKQPLAKNETHESESLVQSGTKIKVNTEPTVQVSKKEIKEGINAEKLLNKNSKLNTGSSKLDAAFVAPNIEKHLSKSGTISEGLNKIDAALINPSATKHANNTATGNGGVSNNEPFVPLRNFNAPPFSVGVKLGYEQGFTTQSSGIIAAFPFLQWAFSDKMSLWFQPGFRYNNISKTNLMDRQTFHDIISQSRDSSHVIDNDTTGVITIQRNYIYRSIYDSVIVQYGIKSSKFWEIELPISLQYRVAKNLAVQLGGMVSFGRIVQVEGGLERYSGLSRNGSLSYAPVPYNGQPSTNYPNPPTIQNYFTYNTSSFQGVDTNQYKNPSSNPARFALVFGFSYTFKERLLIDVLVRKNVSSMSFIPNDQVRSIYTQPYFRLMVGYKLFGGEQKEKTRTTGL